MPVVREPTRIASVLGEQREDMGRHTFRGGNFFILRMLNRYRSELDVAALPAELDREVNGTLELLGKDTARLSIEEATLAAGRVSVRLAVENTTGHKLPTAYPSRRVWIHLTVRGGDGKVIFESGRLAANGSIDGNDNDADPSRFEPHYEEIRQPDQVQIYESMMADPAGRLTTGLLQAVAFVKDNRLLPRGFDKRTAPAEVAVRGSAADDDDFTEQGDRVRYRIDVGATGGPLSVTIALRYQPISFRWAENLRRYEAPEPRRFVSYYDAMAASSSVELTQAGALVP
jgi:hypothetical protein